MAAVPMCTLKFYLYCKENKKGPNLGLEGEAKPQETQAVPLVGSAVAAGGPAYAPTLQRGPDFCAKTKAHSQPDEGLHIFASFSGLWFSIN